MTTLHRVDLYAAPWDLVWLLHANHACLPLLLGLGVDFDGRSSGAFRPGHGGTVVIPGRRSPLYGYRVIELDAALHVVETLETRWPARHWRRRHVVIGQGDSTRVEETVTLEGPIAPFLDPSRSARWSERRARALTAWLARAPEDRPPLPANARAP